jgi:hydrogenase maturation protease
MPRTIVIGYGNIDRADDGAAYEVINALRLRLGQKILEDNDAGLDELGCDTDSVFLTQLVPEIMETLIAYDRIVFVDAHVGADLEDLNCILVLPEYVSSSFTHHMAPSSLLAFLQTLYQHKPECHLVSIRGYDFNFKRTLSPQVNILIKPAVEKILQLIKQ